MSKEGKPNPLEDFTKEFQRLVQKPEKPKQVEIDRTEFWTRCEKGMDSFKQMEMTGRLGQNRIINVMNKAIRYESDPDFRVKYYKLSDDSQVFIDTIPKKKLGFNKKDDK